MRFYVNFFGLNIIGKKPTAIELGIPQSGIFASKEQLSQDYVNLKALSISPENFKGSKADLLALIAQETEQCAVYTQGKNKTISLNGASAACADKINALYGDKLNELSGDVYENDKTAIAQFLITNKLFVFFAVVILIILIIILKSK